MRYDTVIVGARCAGASLATLLARRGARVLVVDRDRLPSDQVLSTHTIHPPGVDVLDELGVGDAWADVSFAPGRCGLCPRRTRLDGLLQSAAVEAGAELRDRTRATDVLFEDDRAVGVRLEARGTVEGSAGASGRARVAGDRESGGRRTASAADDSAARARVHTL